MAIDSIRLLVDSAGPLWRRLSDVAVIDNLPGSDSFEDWIAQNAAGPVSDHLTLQQLRRDYRRLLNLLNELETLVRSRSLAITMIRERARELATAS
jgi:hypothetical protein